jgi:Xaa-Pro aminopeptidase
MTRTLFVGRSSRLWRQRYLAVLEAQMAAIDSIRHGVRAHTVDAAARSTLAAHKLDSFFTHSTGHGLGLEIHEPPRIGKGEKRPLEAGMVVTVEPGIYLEGEGGIRIEDTVLVTQNGCEVLTPTPKKLTLI